MSLDAFSQAFAGTDWDRLAAVAPAPAKVGANPGLKNQTGISGGDPTAKSGQGQANGKGPGKGKGDVDFLTFNDVIDIVNPLQHIPLVDAIYRRVTGDTIRPQGEILGGFLYGGLVGGALATVSVLFHEATGIDPVNDLVAFIAGDDSPGNSQTPHTETAAIPTPSAPTTTTTPHLHSAPIQTAAVMPTPTPTPASAGTRARQAIVAGNQSALQMLAQDLAAGGQVSDAAPAPASTPSLQTAAADTALASQPHPSRMPVRDAVNTKAEPPAALYGPARHYASAVNRAFPRSSTLAGINPARDPVIVGAPPPAVGAALPPNTSAPVRSTPVALSGFLPLAKNPAIRPLDAPAPLAPQVLTPAEPITSTPPTPAEAITPDAIQMLMMRNLDKYQALSRERTANGRNAPRA